MRSTIYHHSAQYMDPDRCTACKALPEVDEIVLMRATLGERPIIVECGKCRPEHRRFTRMPKK